MMFSHLCVFIFLSGVFGVNSDEEKTVSVMEGDSVTLHTDLTELQRHDQILWMFGPQETRIAEIIKRANFNSIYDDGRFRDRLKLDYQTGSLIITDIRFTHSEVYKLQIISNRGTSYKRFSVTVYAHLPFPVIIIRDSSHCSSSSERSSSSRCVLECSVMNVTRVTLSWYKEHSLISNISASDLNIRLSLPLEVEYQDNNTYSCVLNNPIRNQTQHLNITDVCQPCPEVSQSSYVIVLITASVQLVFASAALILCYCSRSRGTKQEDQRRLSEYTEIIYTLQIRDRSQKLHQQMNRSVTALTYTESQHHLQDCDGEIQQRCDYENV